MLGLLASVKGDMLSWLSMIPFLMLVKSTTGGKDKIQMNYTRLFEAALIAVVTAVITSYVLTQAINVEIGFIQKSVNKIEEKVGKIEDLVDKIIWERGHNE